MEDAINIVSDLTKSFQEAEPVRYSRSSPKNDQEQILDDLKESNKLLKRQIAQLKTELRNHDLVKEKNDGLFMKCNNERFRHAKRIVSLEKEIEDLKCKLEQCKEEENKLQENIGLIKQPSANTLFLELMSGFNLQFYRGKCKVINVRKNDVIEIEMAELKDHEITNKIWRSL
ncbi:hypothetical protein VCUG_01747 [Vavraia culicis subsp. floridensis]|uniref:Kinetochore protein Spc24 n=1 Tax=Vavraia culicis (isolate floridensis) TaxID=948595 RepID=L2GU13_VAVCU|nr:uncharacterized protein VCUG_01747 [Vavraia culicis subsp. floridensis]ELA46788.1 hypothetical protein VCUG_01747 [Vavraia culicis subsp. floridensis]